MARGSKLYQSYLFRGKDPGIDELRTEIQDQHGGKLNHKILKRIEEDGGPSVGCMAGWFFGSTQRPQNATMEAAGRANGLKRVWVPARSNRKR
jgi:hypothetical protein